MDNMRDRKVLVTGADGFIGSHLTERLLREGAHVRAFCIYNSQGSRGWLDGLDGDERLEVQLGDIRDAAFVEAACRDVEVVFHLAALVSIPYSYAAPESFVATNVGGTLNLLQGARKAGCSRIIHTSTSEVYGTPDSLPIREDHPLKGQSPYSASKIAADKLCEAFATSFETPVVILRPFNTYGPRQSARAVIPTILSQLLAGRRTVSLGSLTPRRDLTFVDDTVEAFVLAAGADVEPGTLIQLGTGTAHSVGELFDIATRTLEVDATATTEAQRIRPERSEIPVLLSDPSLAQRLLGWAPTTTIDVGMRLTADWLRVWAARYRPDSYSV
jgi:NAD dependent epimerase/dehydratase